MPSTKRSGDEPEGESPGVKRKSGSSTRTGQACDRCRTRKIRCDARPGGCSPCLANQSECTTTDRITGRATARGHTEVLEDENASLRTHILELQQQLKDQGVEPKAPPDTLQGYLPAQPYWDNNEQQQGSWGDLRAGNVSTLPTSNPTQRKDSTGSLLPDFRSGCIGDNYLGISSGNDWLSPIEGTSLALFGMRINVAEFLPPEDDPTASPMSYPTFLAYALGKAQPLQVPSLPTHDEFKLYADWYFKGVQTFTPILHRPDFMMLLPRVLTGQHQPNVAETVMMHMVVAIMKFQIARRNGPEQLRIDSMAHYHYALSLIPDLMMGHTLQDIQALVLICAHLRNQPRPGAAWMFTNLVFGIVVETGLHRSASNWEPSTDRDPHTVEMRKRIFWTILLLHVHIGGKLGRPMPIRLEDFDIEIPEALPDHLPSETDLSKWQRCSFRAGLQGFKEVKILMQAYSTVYSVRSGQEPYDLSVQNVDKQLQAFREQLPAELTGGSKTIEEDRSPALYIELGEHITRLMLHHPSLCRSTSSQLLAKNLDVCLDASSKLLAVAVRMKDLQALDTTWMQTTDFLAAIFSTLFVWSGRKSQMRLLDLEHLRRDMDAWLGVLEESGKLLGAGLKLRQAVKQIIDSSLEHLSNYLAAKTASAGLRPANGQTDVTDQDTKRQSSASTHTNAENHGHQTTDHALPTLIQQQIAATDDRQAKQEHAYPANNPAYYHQEAQHIPLQPPGAPFYGPTSYNGQVVQPNGPPPFGPVPPFVTAQFQGQPVSNGQMMGHPQQSGTYVPMFRSPPQQQNGFYPAEQPLDMLNAGPLAWRDFTSNMITNIGAQDYMTSASALVALGGAPQGQPHWPNFPYNGPMPDRQQ